MRYVAVAELSPTQRQQTRDIYEANFAPELRAPFESLSEDRALAYIDDEAHGFAVVRMLPSTGWVFLRYFVAGEQGRGLGSRMWADLCAMFPDADRIVLDVEHANEPGIDPREADIRRRRIRFYERLGVTLLPVRSYQPPHDDGHAPSMQLLARDLGPDAVTNKTFTAAEVRRIVLAVLHDRYGVDRDADLVVRTLADSGLAQSS